jgi:hypothetical protein
MLHMCGASFCSSGLLYFFLHIDTTDRRVGSSDALEARSEKTSVGYEGEVKELRKSTRRVTLCVVMVHMYLPFLTRSTML